eukprot:1143698-Pelagomonas_calceolata.AAC.1
MPASAAALASHRNWFGRVAYSAVEGAALSSTSYYCSRISCRTLPSTPHLGPSVTRCCAPLLAAYCITLLCAFPVLVLVALELIRGPLFSAGPVVCLQCGGGAALTADDECAQALILQFLLLLLVSFVHPRGFAQASYMSAATAQLLSGSFNLSLLMSTSTYSSALRASTQHALALH